MPATDFQIAQGNLLPLIEQVLLDGQNKAINLLGLTVLFRLRGISGDALGRRFDRTAEIIDAAGGHVRYTWVAEDTQFSGTYIAEWVIVVSGKEMSVPNNGYVNIRMRPKV
jgi:hypothetical protein